MPGRPPASYAYPNIWTHVEQLGYPRSYRAIKKLARANGVKLPCDSTLSDSFIEDKCNPDRPKLIDYNAAVDLAHLIIFHLKEKKKIEKSVNPADEVVRFDRKIIGWHDDYVSHRGQAIKNLAIAAGFPDGVIEGAISGRLLPYQICVQIIQAAGTLNIHSGHLSISKAVPGKGFSPLNNEDLLSKVLIMLADPRPKH